MDQLLNQSLSSIVTSNYQAAQVFEKYGLDFCCKGKRPLVSACEEKAIDTDNLLRELNEVLSENNNTLAFDQMRLSDLIGHIVNTHHSYVKDSLPRISSYIFKVATKHGERFPYMKQVYVLFTQMKKELEFHMEKEEQLVFPRIEEMEEGKPLPDQPQYLRAPIDVMEEEHEVAGTFMKMISELTSGYNPPAEACTTFRVALNELKGFEADLHQHVHLENNILFPKAIALLKERIANEAV